MVRGIIKQIFRENWDEFVELYGHRIRPHVQKEVIKMIECGSLENGYIEFKCEACGEEKKVGFTCKSRLCPSCGKAKVDNWSEELCNKIGCGKHRHMVFTIPEELRIFFRKFRNTLSILPKCASEVLKSWYRDRNKKLNLTPGIVAVIHTFGRDLKWNPHVHMLVTEGAMSEDGLWKIERYIPYAMLRKRWQKLLLDELEKEVAIKVGKKQFRNLKNKLYAKLENGFYVYGKGEVKDSKGAAKYVGRYTGRPAIAESRIVKYDGSKVTIKYERHEDGKKVELEMDVLEFIGKVISHLPDKNFKMIRYYGMYSKNNKHKGKFFKLVHDKLMEANRKLRRWKYRILKSFGIDPLKCEKCGKQMILNDIYYKKYGSVLDSYYEKIKNEVKKEIEEIEKIDSIIKRENNIGAIFV